MQLGVITVAFWTKNSDSDVMGILKRNFGQI